MDCSKVGLECSKVGLECSKVGLECSKVRLEYSKVGLEYSKVGLECLKVEKGRVPVFRGQIHLLLSILSPVLIIWLLYAVVDPEYAFEYLVSFFCCFFNFSASAALHFKRRDKKARSIYARVDYAGIFLMIGGSGLPAALSLTRDDLGVFVLLLQWVAVAVGAVGTLVFGFLSHGRKLRVLIFFMMASPYIYLLLTFYRNHCHYAMLFLSLSLLFYAMGGIMYACGSPNPFPGFFGYHELFHSLCAVALVTTFFCNHVAVKSMVKLHKHLQI